MNTVDYSSIFKKSLNDTIEQIDLFCQSPKTFPVTLLIRLSQSDIDNVKEFKIKTCASLSNYFLGLFEGISRTRLSNVHNITITPENCDDYLTEIQPFFNELKKHLHKLETDEVLDIYITRGNSPLQTD